MTAEGAHELVDSVYRSESRRVLATLIRVLGGFDLAEEALHDAFAAAMEQWPRDGVPANPRAWLVSVGRFKAIDGIRRQARFDTGLTEELAEQLGGITDGIDELDEEHVVDDQLRLIFTCCHPALTPDAQIALTLREVCGLTTEEIAHAFLTAATTVAQRIVRAKAKIRDARIPYQVPSRDELPDRLDVVLQVIYLVFNEGYSASSGTSLTRHDLSGEAIRLGKAADRVAARARGDGTAGADAAAGIEARSTYIAGRRDSLVGRSRPLAMEPRPDRRRFGAGRARTAVAPIRPIHACRQRSQACTRKRPMPLQRIGKRSSAYTMCCCARIRRP